MLYFIFLQHKHPGQFVETPLIEGCICHGNEINSMKLLSVTVTRLR